MAVNMHNLLRTDFPKYARSFFAMYSSGVSVPHDIAARRLDKRAMHYYWQYQGHDPRNHMGVNV